MLRKEELQEKFLRGFLGFWVKQFRISYLIVLLLVVLGGVSMITIPKESSPAIKLGIISISTAYPGTNPIDIDTLVTDKIYKEVKDIKGIDKITSSSSLGFSNITLTLRTDAPDVKDVISDVRNGVTRAVLPTDAKTPTVTEIETNTNQAFSLYVSHNDPKISKDTLVDRAQIVKKELENVKGINTVTISEGGDGGPVGSIGGDDSTYESLIIIPHEKLISLGLSLSAIESSIKSYNMDVPIGNYPLGEKKYDFRIDGKMSLSREFLDIPVNLPKGGTIKLGDISRLERKYKSETSRIIVPGGKDPKPGKRYIALTINKTDSSDIFSASDAAKKKIEEIFQRDKFQGFSFDYGVDLADNIRQEYKILLHEALTTLALVFVAMYLFVGFRDSLFACVTLPLAYFSTFILLDKLGYTMNFLTNFSLILSFGIAIDTIIVIVQAASAKIRVGYDPRSAIMLALREYAVPVISGVSTTIVVFIPMMVLPGILGKFLAYIPITIFGVLATGLVLALTVNSALYLLFVKRGKSYVNDLHAIEYATDEEKELLILEREGKSPIEEQNAPLRIRIIHTITHGYKKTLRKFLESKVLRRVSIYVPVVLLVLSFIFLAPRVGFELFPGDDNAFVQFSVTGPVGQKREVTEGFVSDIAPVFAGFPEVKYATINITGNRVSIGVQLTTKDDRKGRGERSVYEIEKIILERLTQYREKGYNVVAEVLENGPPGSKAVGLKIIADSPEKLDSLIQVSKDFEAYLRTIPGTKNIGRSSSDTPGQFIFTLKRDVIAQYGINPMLIYGQIRDMLNGVTVGTIEDNGRDIDVLVKSDKFLDEVKVEDVLSLPIIIGPTTYEVKDLIDIDVSNATASVNRTDGDIQITVDADLEVGYDSVKTTAEFTKFASAYKFPTGITYGAGGENEENSELIVAVLSAFFISILAIFAILTLQFHSFSQPAIVLYSVIMALPFVMIGLILTGNKFSMPFGIGFIAFTGIAVNHGIILIDAINHNLKKGMTGIVALVEAGSSRLEPMTLTTVTTVLGILPVALRDRFWSGMGFTIVFGIMATTLLTLFIVKGIYYELYMNPEEGTLTKFSKWLKGLLKRKRKTL